MEEPVDPITLMAAGAVEMHEMFTSYIKAGFTRKEALYLIGQQIQAMVIAGQSGASTDDQP